MEKIAEEAAKRYGEGGPITLSFGLMLAFFIWSMIQQTKNAEKVAIATAADRVRSEAAAAAQSAAFLTEVKQFTVTVMKNNEVTEAMTRAMERIGDELTEVGSKIRDFDNRIARIEQERRA